jgi:hypothetical protein
MLAGFLLLALQAPGIPADSYADSATAAIVRQARAARDRNERLVTTYTATVSQRLGVGIRALSRDRMLYRQELSARITWHRDARSTIEVTGFREGIPIAQQGDRVPDDLDSHLRWLVVNPAEDYLSILGDDDEGFVYPLRIGGEHDYRFARGDTTRIDLPSGRPVRLVELQVTPRRSDWQLMSGSLWFDADTWGLVRAVFRPARPYEFRRDADPDDLEDVPGFVNGTGEIRYITMEYGLYEGRWWMLRYVALDGVGSVGKWMNVPVRFERIYADYEVEGGTAPDPASTFRPAGTERRRERDERSSTPTPPVDPAERRARTDSLRAARDACIDAQAAAYRSLDSLTRQEQRRVQRDWSAECWREVRGDTALAVIIPDDREALRTSPTLGEPILQMGDLITEEEVRGLADAIKQLPVAPLGSRLELPRGLSSLLQNARYNRIEALSLGAQLRATSGRFGVEAMARLGLADLEPGLDLALTGRGRTTGWRISGYHGLAIANPETRAFGAVNSLSALFLQRDDGEYYRTTGVALSGETGDGGWLAWRLFAERQRPAWVETQASLPHLFSDDQIFRPNLVADSAEQAGAALGIRFGRQVSQGAWLGGDLAMDASTGDFRFGRGAVTVRAIVTPESGWALALEGAAGTSRGTLPAQSKFFLGGPATLRGYGGAAIQGDAFWRARAEVGNAFPAARLTVFSDAGWAGPRTGFSTGKPLLSAGVGASFLDGLIRLDLARALRSPTGWRFDIYFDGRL